MATFYSYQADSEKNNTLNLPVGREERIKSVLPNQKPLSQHEALRDEYKILTRQIIKKSCSSTSNK